MQAGEATWLPANSDVLLFGAIIGCVLIGDSLPLRRPARSFLLVLAACLAAIGTASAVFAIGVQFDVRAGTQLGSLGSPAAPRPRCGFGARRA